MKIDIHLHSVLSSSNGDGIIWSGEYNAIEKLSNSGVEIAAFTDHNIFDPNFYLKAKKLAESISILLLPGIEVNVVRTDGKPAHVLYLFDENLSEDELNQINKIAKTKIPKTGISLKKCNSIFENFETIIIPHVGKSDFLKCEDLKQIKYDAIEISDDHHPNYLSVMKNSDVKTSIVAFSDTHLWNKYPQVRNLITVIDGMTQKSFKELKSKLLLNKNYTKRRIND